MEQRMNDREVLRTSMFRGKSQLRILVSVPIFTVFNLFGFNGRLKYMVHEHLVQLSLLYIFLVLVQQFTRNFHFTEHFQYCTAFITRGNVFNVVLEVVSFLFQPCFWKFQSNQIGNAVSVLAAREWEVTLPALVVLSSAR